jgi:hypothetical protein
MLIRRSARIMLAPVAMAAALFSAAGCGLSAGDHVFYRLALDATESEASCYPDDEIPNSVKDDTTTLRGGATFILYVTGDEEVALDTGSLVLPGTATDNGYKFSGNAVNVTYPPGDMIIDADQDGIDDDSDPMVDADKDGIEDDTDPEVDTDADNRDDRSGDPLVDANGDGKDDRRREILSPTKFTETTKVTIDMTVDGATISGKMTTITEKECSGDACPMNYANSCTRRNTFEGIAIEQADVNLGGNPLPQDD